MPRRIFKRPNIPPCNRSNPATIGAGATNTEKELVRSRPPDSFPPDPMAALAPGSSHQSRARQLALHPPFALADPLPGAPFSRTTMGNHGPAVNVAEGAPTSCFFSRLNPACAICRDDAAAAEAAIGRDESGHPVAKFAATRTVHPPGEWLLAGRRPRHGAERAPGQLPAGEPVHPPTISSRHHPRRPARIHCRRPVSSPIFLGPVRAAGSQVTSPSASREANQSG